MRTIPAWAPLSIGLAYFEDAQIQPKQTIQLSSLYTGQCKYWAASHTAR
jgi:hypothetical protein